MAVSSTQLPLALYELAQLFTQFTSNVKVKWIPVQASSAVEEASPLMPCLLKYLLFLLLCATVLCSVLVLPFSS